MSNFPPHSFFAGTAIAVVLALGSTPAAAQDATPTIDAPPAVEAQPPATPPPPLPAIVLPPELTAPATVQAEPARAETTAETTQAKTTQAKTTSPARASVAPRAAASAEAAQAPAAPPPIPVSESGSASLIGAVSGPEAVDQPAPTSDAGDTSNDGMLLAGLMAALVALGAGGAFALGRKRRPAVSGNEPVAEAPVPAPAAAHPTIAPASAGWVEVAPGTELPFQMPAGPVPTGAAREDLLRRMVAAPPDAANPFRSPAARRKRARIILQTREHQRRQDATRPFDFRTYQPDQTPATAARETEPADA